MIIETEDGVDLLPATIELARAEADLLTRTGREHVLKAALEDLAEDGDDYDWVLLDCPPSLGVLTVAALTAADGVLIPLQCETLSHRGVGQLLDTVHDVRRFTNRELEVWGVLPTLYDGRTNHARTVLETISRDLRPRGHRAADPQDDQVRRGAGRRPLDPGDQPQQQGRAGLPRGRRQPGRPRSQPVPTAPKARQAAAGEPAPRADRSGPRYGRLGACSASSLAVTAVAVLGGVGVLPSAAGRRRASDDRAGGSRRRRGSAAAADGRPGDHRARRPAPSTGRRRRGDEPPPTRRRPRSTRRCRADSGTGRRVVFSEGRQRVWLVDRRTSRCVRTYLVSGSVNDNLDPGTYAVYSRSEHAVGRSTTPGRCGTSSGSPRATTGRHRLPRHPGRRRHAGADRAQLGTPQSHGCIRQ